MNSIRANDRVVGQAVGFVCDSCLHLDPSILLAIRTLHPLGPLCRQRRHHDQVPPWRSWSVGSSVALCQADTLSSSCCARTEVILSTFAIPFPTSPFQNLCWAVVARLWIALSLRELNECVYGLNFLGDFTSSGYLDVNAAASSGWAFTYRRILHSLNLLKRPEALEVGEGALSKLLAGKVCDYVGFSSVLSAGTGALAPFRKSHVSLPTSAVNAPSLAHICGDVALFLIWTVLRSACCSQKRIIKNASLVRGSANIYFDPLLGHNDRVCSDFVCSLVKSGSFTFLLDSKCQSGIFCVYKKNLSLRLHFGRQTVKPTFQGTSQIPHGNWDSFSRVELLIGNLYEGEALALHIASGDVQNAFHHVGIPEWLRSCFCLRPFVSSRFRHDREERSGGSCLRGARVVSCATHVPIFPWSMFLCQHVGSSRRIVRISQLSFTDGGPPVDRPSLLGRTTLWVFAGTTPTILVPSRHLD